jgi:hypothetical protein
LDGLPVDTKLRLHGLDVIASEEHLSDVFHANAAILEDRLTEGESGINNDVRALVRW